MPDMPMMQGQGDPSAMMLPPQQASDALDPALIQAIQQVQMEDHQKAVQQELEQRKKDLHDYLRNWLAKSMMSRRANYEIKWERWRRNSRSIYDPSKLAQKEKWQSAMFVPLSMQTKEIIKGQIHRTLVAGLPYKVSPRPSGNIDEASAIQDLQHRELERAEFELAANDVADETCTYGNGFLKLTWLQKMQLRRVRKPVPEPMTPDVLARLQQGIAPKIAGYQSEIQPRIVYNGLKTEFVSIWDMFFQDGAKDLRNAACMQRTKFSYQQILDGIVAGWALPEAQQALHDVWEKPVAPNEPGTNTQFPDNRGSQITVPRTINEKEHTVYEAWMELPQKWVYIRPDEQQLIQDPDRLVPAKILFTAETLVAVDENPEYDGDNPFEIMGYIHVPGCLYHMGPLEMIEQIQEHLNEDVNQRKDNEQLAWNRMFVMLESAIVSKSDMVSRPGGGIRVKKGSTDDVRKALMYLQTPDLPPSAWQEPFHAERYASEVTGVSRQTIASGGSAARDVTQTKGGMEILQQAAADRSIYYAMLIEVSFIRRALIKSYVLIYSNITPDQVQKVLGPQRAAIFQLRTPEEVCEDYYFAPEGVFSNMHAPIRIQQWQALRDQYNGAPFWNDMEFARVAARAVELPEVDKILVPLRGPDGQPIPFEVIQHAMIAGGAPPADQPGQAGAEGTTPKMATKKAGRNAPIEGNPAR